MAERFDLLFVCTGNICRSPTAELYAAHHLPREHFRVHSAGTWGLEGYPIEPSAARRLGALGIGYDAFRARRVTAAMVEAADLVLTATRHHRDELLDLVPDAAERTFAMREFARRADAVDEAMLLVGPPAERARALVRAAAAVTVAPGDDDVLDPYGAGDAAYDLAAEQIVAALRRPLYLLQSKHDVLGS